MTRHLIPQLAPDPGAAFPDPAELTHPDGLLAWGGDLHPDRLLRAYRRGIFPWYQDPPILWWSPTPRAVLLPGHVHVSRRLRRTLRQGAFRLSMDEDFAGVIDGCAGPREDQTGTWITHELRSAFVELHQAGHAHSLEVWIDDELAGGLYGLSQGKIFFAESKFHRRRDASKIALVGLMHALQQWRFLLADCQIWNPHLERMGVRLLDGNEFRAVLAEGTRRPDPSGSWHDRFAALNIDPEKLIECESAA
ncbi:MAG: leucyl/phenylalanyl-tRNA--protein transferase [Wenzhouxiangella sp.]|jgi:leucyl/phenylalanyl-tRNA--protein transferase|nr:leucyl/phenylalanyl-tRNA--protein transferase [Wenzhouxiangella sp.]